MIHCDAFGCTGCAFRVSVRNEGCYFAVSDTPNTDPSLTTRVISVTRNLAGLIGIVCRFGVGYVHGVVFVDEYPTRPAELLPLGDEFTVLIKNLDAIIGAVSNKKPAFGIESQGVRSIEFAGGSSKLSPSLNELSIF